jgi:lipoprotein-releasing system permease protein
MNRLQPFEWIAAIRFFREGRSQTILTIVGASVGVAVIVFMSALLSGVQANIFAQIMSTQAHIVISPVEDVLRPLQPGGAAELETMQRPPQRLRSIDQWQTLVTTLSARADVISISPLATGGAFAVRGDASKGVSLVGIDPVQYYRIVDLPAKMAAGSADIGSTDVLIGKQLASDIGIALGEKLRIRTENQTAGEVDATFTVKGVFDLGDKGANTRTIYVTLRAAQTLLGLTGGVTTLNVNITDPYQAEVVAAELRSSLGVNTESWIVTFNNLFNALRSQDVSFYSIEFFVAVAVALGIASVLVVSVVQRRREIGILRAMGASRGQVLRIFLVQGALIGLMGSFFGSLVAVGFVWLWRLLARNADGTPFFLIPLSPTLFIVTGIAATLLGILTAFLPALGAARLSPVDAIRG